MRTYYDHYAFGAILIHETHLGVRESLLPMIMGRNADLQVLHMWGLMDSHDTGG